MGKPAETLVSNNSFQTIKVMSPGKVILFGEHFVVYGYPSLIASIEKYFKVTVQTPTKHRGEIIIKSNLGFTSSKHEGAIHISPMSLRPKFRDIVTKLYKIIDYLTNTYETVPQRLSKSYNKDGLFIKLDSELPLGGGLGSSSAFCVALSASLYYAEYNKLDRNKICDQSINAEKIINIETSGADCNICSFGGIGTFNKISGFKRISANMDNYQFLIINTGVAHDTYSMVERVSKFKENNTKLFNQLCKSYFQVYEEGIKTIQKQNLNDLGILINQNHELLSKLSISNVLIDKIVETCNSFGALGTKITGAGGGGCVLSLLDRNNRSSEKKLLGRLDELGLSYFFAKVDKLGLRLI
jgi:mevalonate kinase